MTSYGAYARAQPPDMPPARLGLLGGLELRCGGVAIPLSVAAQRLLAFLALHNRHLRRSTVAYTLWMNSVENRAAANLRTVLWRLRKLERSLVVSDGPYLRIGGNVQIDVVELTGATRQLIADPQALEAPKVTAETLSKELLPGWDDDWVLLERERLRQLRLHGLEALCKRLTALGLYEPAIEAGLIAVALEPLRETTQCALIEAHLDEGNVSEAVRQYDVYRDLLDESLGIAPGRQLRSVIAPYR
ncbi:DNA-binding transcriptional activator of the SARP family [Nocardia amikacinitolerans]|uniref:DNA-binding transcriptional activator of the SARP family n=1 Tax=Nocardia amikacinitolerans TaxID=756689 RepID=A0A285KZD5_9NOCA|nr:BTAD domain-containing putative transcriptional regulator [Nocardia amikacinitolerans]MCP2296948.1 DNA-binding transcriptional activator of the SARP family [Nocardia amikacinitolerans]SNY78014.1 DNA-binding transcriptional activator of the SARP family [Nocardia amikacinitolerans]